MTSREIISDTLHIVFSAITAGSLQYAAGSTGRHFNEMLTLEIECPHVGPINLLGTPEARLDWIRSTTPNLYEILICGLDGADPDIELISRWNTQIDRLKSWEGDVAIWFSRYDIQDVSYLSVLSRIMPNFESARVVDIGDLVFNQQHPVSTGLCNSDQLLFAERYLRPVTAKEINQLHNNFERFRESSKGVRVFKHKEPTEVPLDHQDNLILNAAGEKWRAASEVFGEVLGEGLEEGVFDRDYLFLLSRLHHLSQTGALERRDESTRPLFEESPLMGDVRRVVLA